MDENIFNNIMDFFDEWEDTLNHRIDTTIEMTNGKPELNNHKELEKSFYNRFQKSK